MRRSKYRRASRNPKWFTGKRRLAAAGATFVAFAGIVTVTQVSDAGTDSATDRALAACDRLQAPRSSKLSTETRRGTYTTNNGRVTQHSDDGASDVVSTETLRQRCRDWVIDNVGNPSAGEPSSGPGDTGGGDTGGNTGGGDTGGNTGGGDTGGNGQTPPPGAGLGVIANSCEGSQLEGHDGFQKGDRCVSTAFGEVPAAANDPTLLIAQAPRVVRQNQAFTIQVSSRNLIRDRFLAAGKGGYYVESSVLQGGIVRGHIHTACRSLSQTRTAPANPEAVPEFFVATEDQKGGRDADVVAIQVPGIATLGTLQCSSWAGDGSHRIPMMERANQTPAFDSVRIQVVRGRG